MTTRLSSLEGYPSSPFYAICTLLLEYRRDLRPEPREHVPRELGAGSSGVGSVRPEFESQVRGACLLIYAQAQRSARSQDYASPDQMGVVSAWWVLWVVRGSRSDPSSCGHGALHAPSSLTPTMVDVHRAGEGDPGVDVLAYAARDL